MIEVEAPLGRRPIRVAVVDDSPLMRQLIVSALAAAPDIEAVGSAGDADAARHLIRSTDPDVVTLDIEMPGMDGLEFLMRLMALRPTPVIMVSNLTPCGTDTSLRALQIGAVDVVQKPQSREERQCFENLLRDKVRLAASAMPMFTPHLAEGQKPNTEGASDSTYGRDLVAIGASTGGVSALSKVLHALPRMLPPVVIVQHMPKEYTSRFAARLASELRRDVGEAREGERLGPGTVRIAPGNRHLRISASGRQYVSTLDEGPPVNGHRPSVDVLFESVAVSAGPHAVGVILTGMGRDGARGLASMRRAGAACLGQDRPSSVVWGMPRAARELDAVSEVVSLDRLAARIRHHLLEARDLPGGARD